MKELNEMSLKELSELQQQLGKDIEKRIQTREELVRQGKTKTCVICGKKHNCREHTCSDECHDLFKQKLIKEFGEYKIVVDAVTGKEHQVPTVDIIERGIKQEDLKNYPIVEKKLEVRWINLDTHEVEIKEVTWDEYIKEIDARG